MNILPIVGVIAIFLGILTAILNLAAAQDIKIKKDVCLKVPLNFSVKEIGKIEEDGVYEVCIYPYPSAKEVLSFEFIHFTAFQEDLKQLNVICPIIGHEIIYRENFSTVQKKIKTLIFHISPEIYRGTSIENIIV